MRIPWLTRLAYEVGAFIRNPLPELLTKPNLQELMLNRFEQFANLLKIDRQRLIDWSFVQAILAAGWAQQDKSANLADLIQCAKIINSCGLSKVGIMKC